MKPVQQSKLYLPDAAHHGNCLAACLASLLELPLWMVPPFEEMFARGNHFPRMEEWLLRLFKMQIIHTSGHEVDKLPEFYIANGYTVRKTYHAVIYSRGALVHDPHYSGDGIQAVVETNHLQAVP